MISANCLTTKPRSCSRRHSRHYRYTVPLFTHSSPRLLEGQTSSPVRDAVLTLEAVLRKRGSAAFAVGCEQAQTAVRDSLGRPSRHTAVPGSAGSLLNASWNSIWIISTACSPFRHFFFFPFSAPSMCFCEAYYLGTGGCKLRKQLRKHLSSASTSVCSNIQSRGCQTVCTVIFTKKSP